MADRVIVVGSGAAGLTASLLAADEGSEVVLLEASSKIGGTTAVSGGNLWIPCHPYMDHLEYTDSYEEALTYARVLSDGKTDEDLIERYLQTGPEMVRYLEDHTPLKLSPTSMPDYQPEVEGGKPGGRGLEPELVSLRKLPDWKDRLRRAPVYSMPFTIEEIFTTYQAHLKPQNFPEDLMVERQEKEMVASGEALVARLLMGILQRDRIEIQPNTRAVGLIEESGRVRGARVLDEDGDEVTLSGKVILACGGFEWNADLKDKFLSGPLTHPNSPPLNKGDALRMSQEVGADIGNLQEAWWFPSGRVPGETYEGEPLNRQILAERTAPHCILANEHGERFVNEASTYNDMSKAFFYFDPSHYEYRNLPCWSIFDSQYRDNYVVLNLLPSDPDPDWLTKADSLDELAGDIGMVSDGLRDTVETFNQYTRQGSDEDFDRGESIHDRYHGDRYAPHPNLGTIEKPPFYAIEVFPGGVGTKGGPITNEHGQVRHVNGDLIPGLYAAGNAMAGISGPSQYGPGGTIGPAMVWGYICGREASQ